MVGSSFWCFYFINLGHTMYNYTLTQLDLFRFFLFNYSCGNFSGHFYICVCYAMFMISLFCFCTISFVNSMQLVNGHFIKSKILKG